MLTTPILCEEPVVSRSSIANKDGIEFKIAATRQEYESAFKLVYDAYERQGLSRPNSFGMRLIPQHLLPTTDVFVAKQQGKIICTMSLVRDCPMGLPMESIFPDHVAERREQGYSIAEVSCLADRRKHLLRSLPVLYGLMRLMAQTARSRGVDQLLVACHPRHSKFYRRALGFDALSGVKEYPTVCGNPAAALALDLVALPQAHPQLQQRFFGTQIRANVLRPRPLPLDLKNDLEFVVDACAEESSTSEDPSSDYGTIEQCA